MAIPLPSAWRSPAGDLEQLLQSLDPANDPFSAARIAELDLREEFPAAACEVLDRIGLSRYYVPVQHGGLLASYSDLVGLWRTVARRDLTAAIGHGKTFLGGACAWVAGEPEQAARLGAEIAGGTIVSWGLTERHHGSDLLAGELAATRTERGWRLHGEKWLINNATRGHMICLLARTDAAGGARGFSVLLVDKRQLASGSYELLPKERTHGIRGADISGILFRDAEIPSEAIVGKPGEGIEIILKTLQLTRIVAVAMSLGAADHALRLTVDFTRQHQLYERRLIELPRARRILGEAATWLLLAEAVSTIGSRSVNALTAELSVISAITKAFVPSAIDEMLSQLAELMGARAFLRDVYANGMFQKLERDHRIIAIFDGSTLVNRNGLINQFHALARAWRNGRRDVVGLAGAATLADPLSALDPRRLRLLSSTGCSVVQALPESVSRVRELADRGEAPAMVAHMGEALRATTELVVEEMAAYTPSPREVPPETFALAARYELCFAGAACLQLWLSNREASSRSSSRHLWQDALWLEACLSRVLGRLRPGEDSANSEAFDRLADVLTAQPREGVFSLLPDDATGSGA